jgi:hypothetical protein
MKSALAASSSRWRHRCPSCDRLLFWELIYCKNCIKLDPLKGRFRLSGQQSRLRSHFLRVPPRKDQVFIFPFVLHPNVALCVECGSVRSHMDRLRHRCYNRQRTTNVSYKCVICTKRKDRSQFPVVVRKSSCGPLSVCNDCLVGAKSFFVPKRKYERRKVHE